MKPSRHPLGRGKADMVPVPMHTPSCSQGRCGATHNPGTWPYTTRCVKVGQTEHGDMHKDRYDKEWPGKFMTLDEELEFRDGGG